ncbi:hypothetical protein WJX75_002593 [Coccomyxa subellipsoidea]|uniref:Uncharacterized protein n=1 Tax=Coccomyxa subellipsoidea TaxID=248742 RepID=A0ABR2YBD7_9CHLO
MACSSVQDVCKAPYRDNMPMREVEGGIFNDNQAADKLNQLDMSTPTSTAPVQDEGASKSGSVASARKMEPAIVPGYFDAEGKPLRGLHRIPVPTIAQQLQDLKGVTAYFQPMTLRTPQTSADASPPWPLKQPKDEASCWTPPINSLVARWADAVLPARTGKATARKRSGVRTR